MCLCSHSYPACKGHEPFYIMICGLSGCTIFSILSHKRHDFRKDVIENKTCVLIFSTNFIRNISSYKKNWTRYFHKCIYVVMESARFFFFFLMMLEISQQIFEKNPQHNISWKSVQWGVMFYTDGWTDGQTDRQTDRQARRN
jgi:hypothetical protein